LNYKLFLLFEFIPFIFSTFSTSAQPSDMVITFGMSQSAVNDWKVGETVGYEVVNSLKLNSTVPVDTFRLRFVLDYGLGANYIYNSKDDYEYVLPSVNKFDLEIVIIYPLG